MKTGRNDPCLCGSGKKFKHCCLAKAQTVHPGIAPLEHVSPASRPLRLPSAKEAAPAADPLWQRLRRFHDGLPVKLLRLADEVFGREALIEAWDEFSLGEDVPFDAGTPNIGLFMPWFYYHWTPDPEETAVKPGAPRDRTIVEVYLERRGRRLEEIERRSLEAALEAPFSFFEVMACQPGAGFRLRDLLCGDEHEVTERSASRAVERGDVLLAKVVRLDHLAVLDGCAPVPIPPVEKGPILELRRKIRAAGEPVSAARLRDYDLEMFAIYHEIADQLLNPPMPVLHNTDGDPLVFHKLLYDIDSPQATFDALKDLALDEREAELLGDAEYDAAGVLRKVEFAWKVRGNNMHKHWDNTIRGHIVIDGDTLRAEVNSGPRAAEFRALAEQRLADMARYRTTAIEPPEAMLAQAAAREEAPEEVPDEARELQSRPEVQAAIAGHLANHYESWPNEKLPLLDGKTPLQAVRDPDGREMVEALIVQAERDARGRFPVALDEVFARLRSRLGLPAGD